jgi:SSS family solute:Na+ symporter
VNAVVSVGILALFMVAACVLGVRAGRGRDRKDLAEWPIGGRSLGLVMTLVLMAGETYTTFSYLGAAGWSFTHGVSARCSPSPPASSCSPTSSCRSPAWARSSRP